MIKKTPDFWYKPLGWKALLLLPLAGIFALCHKIHLWYRRRWGRENPAPPVPVICVGNFIVGGAGKTPVARALRKLLAPYTVHFLTRGYKGKEVGPVCVNSTHQVFQVGDEALLLSQDAPTWVARHRQKGIQIAYQEGAEIIIMDDGLQNLSIKKTLSFVVVDQQMGFGNGCILPAGPLRERPEEGLKNVNACIVISPEKSPNLEKFYPLLKDVPTFIAVSKIDNIQEIPPIPLIAFAGIGYPEKFFSMVKKAGFIVVDTLGFPDHYPYTLKDIQALHHQAKIQNAQLVTTEKDYVRLPLHHRHGILVVKMRLEWQDPLALTDFIHQFL